MALDALCHALLLIAAFVALFPLFWTLSTSIKQRADTFALPPRFLDFVPTWKNYLAIFATDGFWRIYGNTVIITVALVAATLSMMSKTRIMR